MGFPWLRLEFEWVWYVCTSSHPSYRCCWKRCKMESGIFLLSHFYSLIIYLFIYYNFMTALLLSIYLLLFFMFVVMGNFMKMNRDQVRLLNDPVATELNFTRYDKVVEGFVVTFYFNFIYLFICLFIWYFILFYYYFFFFFVFRSFFWRYIKIKIDLELLVCQWPSQQTSYRLWKRQKRLQKKGKVYWWMFCFLLPRSERVLYHCDVIIINKWRLLDEYKRNRIFAG